MQNIKVSIIIAAYNIEKYISRCLDSLVNQTFKNIEIIVVDDGSTDKTLEVINKYACKDDRIIVHSQENKGSIEARKSGFNISNGEYILFVDGDDWVEENTIEILYSNVNNQQNNVDVVLFNFIEVSNNKKEFLESYKWNRVVSDDLLKYLFINEIYPCIWSKFIRKGFIIHNNIEFPNNISYAEDLAFISSIFIKKPTYKLCRDNLYNYYQRDNSITKTINAKALEINLALQFIKRKLIDSNLLDKYKYEYECMVFIRLFLCKILDINYVVKSKEIHKEIFLQYKEYNINIKNNDYIRKLIRNRRKIDSLRINLYSKNYYLGYYFDIIINPIRKIKKYLCNKFIRV